MKAMAFDGIAREMGEASTRRSFFRLLGGAAAVGAGLAVTARDESLGKGRGNGKGKSHGEDRDRAGASVTAERRGGKKITICYQGQTRTVKKSKLGNFPGATRGACPVGGNTSGTGGTQQPVACTSWIISGGPNPTVKIHVDDDLNIWRASNGAGILTIMDRVADPITPVPFEAQVGEVLMVRAFDWGGCRSMSELWLHCIQTGQKRRLLASHSGNGSCNNGYGIFVDARVTVEL